MYSIALDTTGLSETDEILAITVIDCDSKEVLLNKKYSPSDLNSFNWADIARYSGFNRSEFESKDAPPVFDKKTDGRELSKLLMECDGLVAYNGAFVSNFLDKYGIEHLPLFDMQTAFKDIYKKPGSYGRGDYDFVSLRTMCNYYGLKGGLHTTARKAMAVAICYNLSGLDNRSVEPLTF